MNKSIRSDAEDLYAVLNVPRDASLQDIKTAYRRLCVMFHPDKHSSAVDNASAQKTFERIKFAYQTLSNHEQRVMYDLLGSKVFDQKLPIVPSTKYNEELKEEYEKLMKYKQEVNKLLHSAPSGSMQVYFNLTRIFDRSMDYELTDSDEEQPQSLVTQAAFSHSIEHPLKDHSSVKLNLSLLANSAYAQFKPTITFTHFFSKRLTFDMKYVPGKLFFFQDPNRTESLFQPEYMKYNLHLSHMDSEASLVALLVPGFSGGLNYRISKRFSGIMNLGFGGLSSGIKYEVSKLIGVSTLHISPTLKLSLSNNFSFFVDEGKGNALSIFTRLSASSGFELNISGMTSLTKEISIVGHLGLSTTAGVFLDFRLYRGRYEYSFPMQLSPELNSLSIFYGSVVPLTIFLAIKKLIIEPYIRHQEEKEKEDLKKSTEHENIARKRASANEILLMQETVNRIVANEKKIKGLIIQRAWYGALDNISDQNYHLNDEVIDVKLPLQAAVRDSKLIIHASKSKSLLPGFYDPCVGVKKKLLVVYLFKESLHQVVVSDEEKLRIPLKNDIMT